jgi:tetratricopeptide (TPR) repeat protein
MAKKITKKELKDDKFVRTTIKIIEWGQKNPRIAIGISIALLIVLISVPLIIVSEINYSMEMESKVDLADKYCAEAVLGSQDGILYENYRKAIDLYNEVYSSAFVRRGIKSRAIYGLGNAYFQLSQFDKAKEIYETYLKKYKNKWAANVYKSLGNIEENRGNYTLAIEKYKELIAKYPQEHVSPEAQYRIGKCYEYLKDYDKAIESYQNVVNFYPKSKWVEDAKKEIEKLKTKKMIKENLQKNQK